MTRTAADIGAGLASTRPARAIRPGERIHVIGVAGAGASAAALLAHRAGAIVTGCDSGGSSTYTPALEAAGIALSWSHDPAHIAPASPDLPPDRLAVSKALTAVAPDHPELVAARGAGIPIEPWQQVVADAAVGKKLVAVAGTHGKSTTAGWLTQVLVTAGRDPSAFVGALMPSSITGGFPATARHGMGEVFVVEADEYAGNFDAYRPDVIAITNIDWDHPDVFADRSAVVEAFRAWLSRVPASTVIANVDDPGTAEVLERLGQRPGSIVRVGSEDPANARARLVRADAHETQVELVLPSGMRLAASLPTAGIHNMVNAVEVAATASALGLTGDQIRLGLETFSGVGRRLERKGEAGGVVVYDDYGHHPTAIRATLAALRQREPGRRVWVAHEPLTFHRTAALLGDLAVALAGADGVAVADIWAGRDPDRTIASAAALASAVEALDPAKPVAAPGSVETTADWLAARVLPGDAVLVMGGGRSYVIADRLLAAIRERAG